MNIKGRVTSVHRRDEELIELLLADKLDQRYYVTVFSPVDEEVEPGDDVRLTGVRDIAGHSPGILTFKADAYRCNKNRSVPLSGDGPVFGVRATG